MKRPFNYRCIVLFQKIEHQSFNVCLGFLKNEYNQLWANYLLKFLDEYKNNGIDIWAISTGNEPMNAYTPNFPLTTMGWTPDSMANWVAKFMGPTLASSIHNETLIFALDDNRNVMPSFVVPIFSEANASKYTAGTAIHFYKDSIAPPIVLDWTHNLFPDKVLLMTEASIGNFIAYIFVNCARIHKVHIPNTSN